MPEEEFECLKADGSGRDFAGYKSYIERVFGEIYKTVNEQIDMLSNCLWAVALLDPDNIYSRDLIVFKNGTLMEVS
jgi:hypothetical protein